MSSAARGTTGIPKAKTEVTARRTLSGVAQQRASEKTTTKAKKATISAGQNTSPNNSDCTRSFTILCLNTYLVPTSITWNPYFWAPFWSCRRQQARASQIGMLVREHDIACLQEVWGASLDSLNNVASTTHTILPEWESSTSSPWINEFLNPIALYCKQVGGLWSAWKREKFCFTRHVRKPFESKSQVFLSNQNVTLVEVEGVNKLSGKRLMIFQTHFSIFGASARNVNLDGLKEFLEEQMWRSYLHRLAYTSGFDSPINVIGDAGVVLLGDFNIDKTRSPKSYEALQTIKNCAKMRDLYLPENNPSHSELNTHVTQEQGDADSQKGNSLFPWPFKGRVDYIFGIDQVYINPERVLELMNNLPPETALSPFAEANRKYYGGKAEKQKEYERLQNMKIPIHEDGSLILHFNKLECKGLKILTQPYGQELSDHWPLSASICFTHPDMHDTDQTYTVREV